LAISLTAWKSPSEAIGNPASMMSTPIASRKSATSSFSSKVMVAPGHCSPSRSVVSKMSTRFLSLRSLVLSVMGLILLLTRARFIERPGVGFRDPLSAQAQAPGRPSGAAKEQESENESRARNRASDRAVDAGFADLRHRRHRLFSGRQSRPECLIFGFRRRTDF
jgi:hypothetical protein